jgi:hemerythrin-like metal-binding protein
MALVRSVRLGVLGVMMTADSTVAGVGEGSLRMQDETEAVNEEARRATAALVPAEIATIASGGRYPSLLVMEVDQYALIEHLHGTDAADLIARHLAWSIEATLHRADRSLRVTPARFAALVADGLDTAEQLARSATVRFGRKTWSGLGDLTVSTGLAQRYPGEDVSSWWSRVHSALAQARVGGGGHVVIDRRHTAGDPTVRAPGLHLRWLPQFECGEPTIDRQHRELLEQSEQILESLRQGKPCVVVELERLVAEITTHFADEERILEQHAYGGLEAHRRSHAELGAKSLRLQAAASAGTVSREELMRFLLGEVIADHMLTEDRRFAELFATAHAR